MYAPQNTYQSLLRTENIEPLATTINQLNSAIKNNEESVFELCQLLDGDFHFPASVSDLTESNSKDVAGDDGLFYLIEQKYDLPHSSDDSREGRKRNLRDQINHMKKLRESKIAKNRELLHLVHEYEDEIMLKVLPELRNKLDSSEDKELIYKLVEQKFQREAELFRKFIDKIE
ncbi:hypothetical protein I9W82_003953 [Candida metapsilosis]|uniref:Uncharacterized protein n=1 Tax=Candida metapsilosis TaxID=273372 RepID=A0A8H7ZFC7_9ASCO|nr:hypothetical protein I9W82_003953 [Candida metapsilosis]